MKVGSDEGISVVKQHPRYQTSFAQVKEDGEVAAAENAAAKAENMATLAAEEDSTRRALMHGAAASRRGQGGSSG